MRSLFMGRYPCFYCIYASSPFRALPRSGGPELFKNLNNSGLSCSWFLFRGELASASFFSGRFRVRGPSHPLGWPRTFLFLVYFSWGAGFRRLLLRTLPRPGPELPLGNSGLSFSCFFPVSFALLSYPASVRSREDVFEKRKKFASVAILTHIFSNLLERGGTCRPL